MQKERLNVNVAKAISDFEAAAKEFELKEKIYRIIYRGKGMEFEGFRQYTPDDDAVNIDWMASKRSNQLLVKKYKEERDLDILFVVDMSENMVLGSKDKLKCEYATELIAAMAHLIIGANDKVGWILFSDSVKEFVPPKRGLNQYYLFMDTLSKSSNYGGGSGVNEMCKFLVDYVNESIDAVIFVSDFIRMDKSVRKDLFLIASKFETTALMVKDPLDMELPDVDKEIMMEDPVTNEQILVNPKTAGRIYRQYAIEQENSVKVLFKKSGIDFLGLKTDKYFVYPLAIFLKERVENKGFLV